MRGTDQHKLILSVGHHRQSRFEFCRDLPPHNGQIQFARDELVGHTAGGLHQQLQRNLGISLPKLPNQLRHHISSHRLTGPQQQDPPFHIIEIRQGTAGLLTELEDPVAVLQKGLARLCDVDLPSASVKQHHPQLPLQILDLQADGWLGQIEAIRCPSKIAVLSNRPHNQKLIKGKDRIQIRHSIA